MLSILINFVFTILTSLSNLILTPLMTAVSALIPGFSDFSSAIGSWLSSGISYFSFVLKLFCIPQICITSVVTLAIAFVSIKLIIQTYLLITRIWKTFKV